MTDECRQLTMRVELAVIEHLGIKMYTQLPPVVSELVANSWDAEAEKVDVVISGDPRSGAQQISVSDDGLGMAFNEVNGLYLRVGRNRRLEEGSQVTSGEKCRTLMGRKGIGKLSAFGVAEEIEVRTIKDGLVTHFSMSIDDILQRAQEKKDYHPKLLEDDGRPAKEGEVGTKVVLRKLKRKTPVDVASLRRGLARRFSVLGSDFEVAVNGEPLTVEERDLGSRCEFVWNVGDPLLGDGILLDNSDLQISGWFGTFPKPVPADVGAGVVIMARGKLAQEPTLFDVAQMEAQYALAYLVGELHADFLDSEEKDLISSYRGSVVWESEEGQAMKTWAGDAIRKVAKDWASKRRQKQESIIREDPIFQNWYAHLNKRDQKTVGKIISVITSRRGDDPKETKALFHYVIESFEHKSFADLLREMDRLPPERAADLLQLFHEWRLIEAREIFKIVEGRLAAIKQLDAMIQRNAKEVPEIHRFLTDNPWILEPTWTVVHDEVYYSRLLKEEFPDANKPEEQRRIDLVCMGVGDTVHIVELKRPSVRIRNDEVNQVQRYVGFVMDRLGNHPTRSYRHARGYLVGGKLTSEGRTVLEELTRNIYFYPYDDLLSNAERIHREFKQTLSRFAVERPELKAFAIDAALVETEALEITSN